MKTRSTYEILPTPPSNFVFLVDKDIGMSVTNDAENVVSNVLAQYPGKRIIYRDTDLVWSELVHDGEKFTRFADIDEASWNEIFKTFKP